MNFFLTDIVLLDEYMRDLGLNKLAEKYSKRGITLKKDLSDTRYKRIFAEESFEKTLDAVINDATFDVDSVDIWIATDGKISVVAE